MKKNCCLNCWYWIFVNIQIISKYSIFLVGSILYSRSIARSLLNNNNIFNVISHPISCTQPYLLVEKNVSNFQFSCIVHQIFQYSGIYKNMLFLGNEPNIFKMYFSLCWTKHSEWAHLKLLQYHFPSLANTFPNCFLIYYVSCSIPDSWIKLLNGCQTIKCKYLVCYFSSNFTYPASNFPETIFNSSQYSQRLNSCQTII